MTPAPAALVAAAILLDLIWGDPRWLPHPVVGIGRLISFLEGRLRRLVRGEMAGGFLLLVLVVAAVYLLAQGVLVTAAFFGAAAHFAVSLYLAWTCLAARSLRLETRPVAQALSRGDLPEARRLLSRVVGRDTEHLGEEEIWRGVVETVAENTSDGVIAPLFYLMIGGPALALAYKAVNTLDSMVGYKNEKYLLFGRASARFDDLVNFIPARLTGLLMVIGAPLVGLSGPEALRILNRDGRNHSSPNSGIPEAAAAGALGVRLGGTNRYFGTDVAKPTIGDPRLPLDACAYRGVIRLMYATEGLLAAGWFLGSGL